MVVFPDPEAPTRATVCPALTVRPKSGQDLFCVVVGEVDVLEPCTAPAPPGASVAVAALAGVGSLRR